MQRKSTPEGIDSARSPGPGEAEPPEERGTLTLTGMRAGARLALPFAASSLASGIVFGILSREAGMGAAAAILMSALVSAGTAQLAVLGLWASPLPVAAIMGTTVFVNIRNVLYGATLPRWFQDLPARQRYGTLHFLADESWALATQRFRAGERDAGILLGAGACASAAWTVGTALGHQLGAAIPDVDGWGLDFLPTAVFLALLVGLWKETRARASALFAWAAAAVAAALTERLLPGTWYILVGALAGAVVGGLTDAD